MNYEKIMCGILSLLLADSSKRLSRREPTEEFLSYHYLIVYRTFEISKKMDNASQNFDISYLSGHRISDLHFEQQDHL